MSSSDKQLSLLDYIQTLSASTPTKVKSKRSAHRMVKGSSTVSLSCLYLLLARLSFIVGCHLLSNAKISIVKSRLWCHSIPKRKSSKTSVRDSTTKGKVLKPYWNEQAAAISSLLWLPTKTGLQDLESNSSNTCLPSMGVNSWYSMKMYANPTPRENLQKIYLQSSIFFPADCMVNGEAWVRSMSGEPARTNSAIQITKSKKIRVFPSMEQKKILSGWFGISRLAYNRSIDYLNQDGVKANFMANKKEIYHSLPEFSATCPSHIRQYAIKDAHEAMKAQKVKCLKTGQTFQMKFRSRKTPKQVIKFSVSDFVNGLYKTKLGFLKMSEPLPDNICDAQLTLHNGQYHMVIPFKTNLTVTENQGSGKCNWSGHPPSGLGFSHARAPLQDSVVALDPGVRTFQTFFSPESCGEIGKSDIGRIYRLCSFLDKLMSKKQWNAAARMRIRIKDLVKELHHKTAHFLCSNFKVILLPTFETSQMVNKANRKIRTKTARAMMSWCHFEFKLFIKNKAREFGCKVVDVCEAYTSKTCSWTGELINVGSSKTIKSKVDGRSMDRDINGARGIFIRALVDTPCDEFSSLREVAFNN